MCSPRLAALALVALAGCGANLGHTGRRLGPDATASDVIAGLGFTADPPGTALALPATTRWGSLTGLAQLRQVWLDPDGLVVVAGGDVRVAHRGLPALAAIAGGPTARLVRIEVDRGSQAWFDRIRAARPIAPELDLAAVLDDARARWDAFAAEAEPGLTAALAAADRDTPGQALTVNPRSERFVLFVPSWDGDRLTVTYAVHLRQRTELREYGRDRGCSKYDGLMKDLEDQLRVAPCQPPMPTVTITTRQYAADVALIVTYDRRGRRLGERRFAPRPAPGPAPTQSTTSG